MSRMNRADHRRAALDAFFAAQGPRSRNRVCKRAKVSESTVRGFQEGRTQSLEETTYEKLADATGWTVAQIKGDAPAPDRCDILSQKRNDLARGDSDLTKGIGQNAFRTASASDSPESEGLMSQLRLEIVDKIWELPDDRLQGLKKHIEAIERAVADSHARPQARETL